MIENITPLIVPKNEFNKELIKKLGNIKYMKIENYKLTKEDYDNILIYTNIEKLEVEDIEDFEYKNEIEITTNKNIEFNTKKFQKFKINKIKGYQKNQLTLTIPFDINEEKDFEKLLKTIKDIEILNINIENQDIIDKIIELIYKIEYKINKKIKFINIITQNKTIKNIEKLRFLEIERIIKIWYEDGITDCSVDEFITMRKNIDKIINEVKEKSLTNLETVIYVYDIVKKLKYKQSNNMDGRQLHKIFISDYIVCIGYARLISEILNELEIQSGIYKLITKNNELHTRSFVHIIDQKYDVDALYSMEPTWESALKEDYAYSLFLTPMNKLKQTFPNDKFREDIDVLCGEKTIDRISLRDKISLYKFFNNKDLNQKEIDKLINKTNKEVTLNSFCQALINAKAAQGIEKNKVAINVNKIVNYNNELTNYLNNKLGTNMSFFK